MFWQISREGYEIASMLAVDRVQKWGCVEENPRAFRGWDMDPQPVFLSQCYATSCLSKRDWSLLAPWAFPGCHCSRSPSDRPCNVTKEIGDLHVWFWVRRDKEWHNGAWHVLKLLCHLLDHSSPSRIFHGPYYEHLQRETHSAGRRLVRPPQSYKHM